MKTAFYVVQWWNAKGEAKQSEKMDEASAKNFAGSMSADQDAQIVLVYA